MIANITGTEIVILTDAFGARLATEVRPASFADADTMLAAHGYGRTAPWELAEQGKVSAPVERVDNTFNGTRAARIWSQVGTTHEPFAFMTAAELAARETGDLISDSELSEAYVVAGSSREAVSVKIHMVSEGKTWEERHTGHFMPEQLVMVAKRKA